MKTAELNQILLDFAEAAALSNSRLLQGNDKRAVWMVARGLVAGIAATTSIAGRQIDLRIGLPRNFPYELPVIRLDDAELYPHIPHVEEDGAVCFVIPKGVVIDRHSPLNIVNDAFRRARNTLEEGWKGNVADEFMDEFGAYWRATHPRHHVESFLHVGGDIRKVHLKMAPQHRARHQPRVPSRRTATEADEKPRHLLPRRPAPAAAWKWREKQEQKLQTVQRAATPRWVAEPERPTPRGLGSIFDSPNDAADFYQKPQAEGGRSALYIPLPHQARIAPPRPGHHWSARNIHQAVRGALPPAELDKLDPLTRKCGDELLVILGLHRPSGGTTLIGLRYFALKGVHPLGPTSDVHHLRAPEPVWVNRLDRELITGRGGASTDLASRKVLLIGCGSVGGHTAMMLASAGIGELTLLDGDVLSQENVFRHILGKKALGQLKVKALVHEIEERIPYIKVRGIDSMLDTAIRKNQIDLSAYDLIISATGEPVADLDLNARLAQLRGSDSKPAAIFTWLEPLGIGGHAALSVGGSGCFECLYTPDEEAPDLHNRAAFYAPLDEQPRDFNLDLVGCGSFYAPYSDLDARRTAELAVRLALSTLQGKETESILRSWKGDPAAFLAQGFRLARRHEHSSDDLLAGVAYTAPSCCTCNRRNSAEEQAA